MLVSRVLLGAIALIGCASCLPVGNTIETVDLNYRCLHIHQEGANEKSPVLLIHGLSASISNWDGISQVIALRTGREVCAVDLRNHGDSPSRERFDVEALTEDVAQFLKKRKTEKINIIGHSLGGKVGVHYSLKNPDKVDSLVVEDMRPNGITENALNLVSHYIKFLQEAIDSVPEGVTEQEAKKSIGDFLNQKLKELGVSDGLVMNDEMVQSFQIRLINNKWQWKLSMDIVKKVLQEPDEFFEESKGLYEGPTLFIYGSKSPFDVGGDEENIKKLFPNAKLIPVEGADHMIHGVFKEFEEEVLKLLNGL